MRTARLYTALRAVHHAETRLVDDFSKIGQRHAAEVDVQRNCERFADECREHARLLAAAAARYGDELRSNGAPLGDALGGLRRIAAVAGRRHEAPGLVLLRDLRELYVKVQECEIAWTLVGQGAKAVRDQELIKTVYACEMETGAQAHWAKSRLKQAAPQILLG